MFVPEVSQFVTTTSVVGDDFCFPYLVNLAVKTKIGFSDRHFELLDDNGDLLLLVHGGNWELKKKRTIYNSMGVPVITMCRKVISWHQRWAVYRGESLDQNNLLYTGQKSKVIQLKPQLEVFLAGNQTGEICHFRVTGSYMSNSFKVYKGDALVAEVREKSKLASLNKGSFEARIYPGFDYAFIVSLLVIVDELDS